MPPLSSSARLSPLSRLTQRLKSNLESAQGGAFEGLTAAGVDLDAELRQRVDTLPASVRLSVSRDELRAVDLANVHRGLLSDRPRPTPAQQLAYEAIVLEKQYPVYRVQGGRVDVTTATVNTLPPRLADVIAEPDTLNQRLGPILRAACRIDLTGRSVPYAGTGFVVGPDTVLTNRHVARVFAGGEGADITLVSRFRPRAAFGWERSAAEAGDPARAAGPTVKVVEVLWIHPYWDAALIRFDPGSNEGLFFGAMPLVSEPPAKLTRDVPIGVLGFPAFNPDWDATYNDLQKLIFGGVFEVKRFAPGSLSSTAEADFDGSGRKQKLLQYDASTLGGNSGSAVVDLRSGALLGLHFYGDRERGNYAVPIWELARDRVVRRTMVFPGAVGEDPEWLSQWGDEVPAGEGESPRSLATEEPGTEAGSTSVLPGPDPDPAESPLAPAPGPLTTRFGRLWFETASPTALSSVLFPERADTEEEEDEAQVQARLRLADEARAELLDTLGEPDASERLQALEAVARVGGLEAPGSGATIVLIPGIIGSHLVDVDHHDRAWLDPFEVVLGRIDRLLALTPDGKPRPNGPRLEPRGVLEVAYGAAILAWRAAGHRVVIHAYDWRRPIEVLAAELDPVLTGLGGPVFIAAHSMGGVIASAWASQFPEHLDVVTRAVLVGVPFAGSFAPMQALNGEYPLVQVLAAASIRARSSDLQAAFGTLPGLLGLLPDETVFTGSTTAGSPARLRELGTWPAALGLTTTVLEAATRVHPWVRSTPLLGRAEVILSDEHATAAGFGVGLEGPYTREREIGDGTVPARSAAPIVAADHTFLALGRSHAFLFNHPGVIAAVHEIASGASAPTTLPKWRRPTSFSVSGTMEMSTVDPAQIGAQVLARVMTGRVGPADLRLLMDPIHGARLDLEVDRFDPTQSQEESPGGLELSGPAWVDRYPTSRDPSTLIEPFRSQVLRFLDALRAAGATVTISTTLRPAERAWLMAYAWKIAHGELAPSAVPVHPDIPIAWVHPTEADSIGAARAMVSAYGLAYAPALHSRHAQGRAIDLKIRWSGDLEIRDAAGQSVRIPAVSGYDGGPVLHRVGASYGVMKLVVDPPHWSDDGR